MLRDWASSWSWKSSCDQDQTDAEGQAIAEDLMRQLGIQEGDLIETAYMDMLEK